MRVLFRHRIFSRILAGLAILVGVALRGHSAVEVPVEPPISDDALRHWAFQPLTHPKPPGGRHPIDAFVQARLREKGLELAPRADRETLLRRLCLDLTGLPPSPEQRTAFLSDPSPHAYEALVDRLLALPAYGERWAQHWLDVARFAESDGFEHDKVRKDAWRYRDWVIRAFNEDLPIDRFLQWQIAGDLLAPKDPDAAIATGFLVCGPDMPDINLDEERRHLVFNEMTSTVGAAVLGLSFHCAECHDHKHDPISQADFYQLRAYFEGIVFPDHNKQLPHRVQESSSGKDPSRIWIRGDFRRPGPEVEPSYPDIVQAVMPSAAEKSTSPAGEPDRAQLAQWLTRPDHPLTLRVFANRLWQHHFGRALAVTPNDFGTHGTPPSHPLLLDWLATELPRRGWSLKAMHRLIVTSDTYLQAGHGKGDDWASRLEKDPANLWFSRFPRRRLSGEEIRDAMLAISDRLNREGGGPGFRPPLPPEVTITLIKGQWPVTKDRADHDRRSIYLFARRNLRYPLFDVFDRPNPLASCGRRDRSTTATQSLMLINSDFSQEMARALAARIRTGNPSASQAIDAAFVRVLGREPDSGEADWAGEWMATEGEEGLEDLCLALFNLNEFVYVD